MKPRLMLAFVVLLLWLSCCTQNESGNEIEHVINEQHAMNEEQTINEGYGNYLLVPAGAFLMGDNYDEGNPRERPAHTVYVDAYYIGEYEVTKGLI